MGWLVPSMHLHFCTYNGAFAEIMSNAHVDEYPLVGLNLCDYRVYQLVSISHYEPFSQAL